MAEFIGIAIPEELQKLALPSPEELNYWTLRQQRTFFIDFEIDNSYALMETAKEIIRINNEEKDIEAPDPIKIFIHSYGGDISQALFFCDLIESSHVPVITVATGAAMSAGLLIFLAGKTRYAFKHSKVLIHKGSGDLAGSFDEIDAAHKAYKNEITSIRDYILSHTKIFEATFEKNKSKDWYISGEKLIKFGIADKIVNSITEIN
jgi:ATP-dependent Clp protease protease subunit